MPRKMTDENFRNYQLQHYRDEHIAPINEFVDELRQDPVRGWAPYVAPMYGGTGARLLSVLRDPGPSTISSTVGGFLCMENDDATAEAICGYFAGVGIQDKDIVPWNAYPWYINRAPSATELEAGVDPWKRLIDLMPALKVVMLHGNHAHDGWKRLVRRYPEIVAERKIHVIATYHPSRQAFWHKEEAVRDMRRQHLQNAFNQAALAL